MPELASATAEVKMLDPDLAPRAEQARANDPYKGEAELRKLIAVHARRAVRLASLQADRWGGCVNETGAGSWRRAG